MQPAVLCNRSLVGKSYLITKSAISGDWAAPVPAVYAAGFRSNLHQNTAVRQRAYSPNQTMWWTARRRTSKADKDFKLENYLMRQGETGFIIICAASSKGKQSWEGWTRETDRQVPWSVKYPKQKWEKSNNGLFMGEEWRLSMAIWLF